MLALPPDPYLALKVERDAGLPEIRTAYRKLILKCHPDKIQDPLLKQLKQDEFQQVQSAYELLSSDVEKSRYDNMYKLHLLEREDFKNQSSSPATGRSSRRDRDADYYPNIRVHVAEPRASTYRSSPFASPSKGYAAGTPPSRSYEEVFATYETSHPPRKTASYESAHGYKSDWEKRSPRDDRDDKYERKSKKDDKKDRDEKLKREEKEKRKEAERKERDKEERREEKRRDKERAERKEREKEDRKREKREKEKKAELSRKKDADLKAQTKTYQKHPTIVSSSSESSDDEPKATRRTSGTQEMAPPAASERERKYSETIDLAAQYLQRSGANIPIHTRPKPQATEQFSRQHVPMAAPTPPMPINGNGPFSPPPPQAAYEEHEEPVRRSSGKSSSRRTEKTYKKPSARASSRDPASVEFTHRAPPPLQHASTMPMPPRPSRSQTEYMARPMAPGLNRAQTFQEAPRYSRDRSPPRNQRVVHSDDEDSDGGRYARRSHTHRSPERASKIRYTVGADKTSTRKMSAEDMARHPKSSKPSYHTANTSAPRMEPEYSYTAAPGKVRYATQFEETDVKYSQMPHTATYRVDEQQAY